MRREFTEPYKDPGPQLRVRFGFLTLAPQVETPSCSPQAQNKTQKVCNAAKRVVCSPENSRSSPPSWPTSSGKWWTSRKPTAVLLIEVPRTEGRRWRERERERESEPRLIRVGARADCLGLVWFGKFRRVQDKGVNLEGESSGLIYKPILTPMIPKVGFKGLG